MLLLCQNYVAIESGDDPQKWRREIPAYSASNSHQNAVFAAKKKRKKENASPLVRQDAIEKQK
jgi:hypothetical protein